MKMILVFLSVLLPTFGLLSAAHCEETYRAPKVHLVKKPTVKKIVKLAKPKKVLVCDMEFKTSALGTGVKYCEWRTVK